MTFYLKWIMGVDLCSRSLEVSRLEYSCSYISPFFLHPVGDESAELISSFGSTIFCFSDFLFLYSSSKFKMEMWQVKRMLVVLKCFCFFLRKDLMNL